MLAVDNAVKDLLKLLMDFSCLKDHYLASGTSIALRYNHKNSVDLAGNGLGLQYCVRAKQQSG